MHICKCMNSLCQYEHNVINDTEDESDASTFSEAIGENVDYYPKMGEVAEQRT